MSILDNPMLTGTRDPNYSPFHGSPEKRMRDAKYPDGGLIPMYLWLEEMRAVRDWMRLLPKAER